MRDKMVDVLNRRNYLRNLLRDIDEVLEELTDVRVIGLDVPKTESSSRMRSGYARTRWMAARC